MKRKKAFTLIELLVVVAIIALLISILLPSLSRARELAKRAVCGSNLRGIGQGMHIYANDNREWFPAHYFNQGTISATTPPHSCDVQYVETLGLQYHLPTSASTNSQMSHPSRSLFLLIVGGQQTAGQFVCPSSSDEIDDMRNRGSYQSGDTTGDTSAARAGKTRFDFAGYSKLSYSYQNPYGRRGRPRETLDSRMPISCDKGPYYTAGAEHVTGVGAVKDIRDDATNPPTDWEGRDPIEVMKYSNEEWRNYNSQNHNFEGQNILFVDGHVDFVRKPIAGVHNDNIFTAASDYIDQTETMVGQVGTTSLKLVPLTQTDSYLVP